MKQETTIKATITGYSKTYKYHYDSDLIDRLEAGISAIERISGRPKRDLRKNEELNNPNRTKKISPRSFPHLSSHPQLIEGVNENGVIVPKKVLASGSEDELATYENRFILTLVRYCQTFLETRLRYFEAPANQHESTFYISVPFEDSSDEYALNLRLHKQTPLEETDERETFVVALNWLYERIVDVQYSQLLSVIATSAEVIAPIKRTNLLIKHPDYRAALDLFEFISGYTKMGVEIEIGASQIGAEEINRTSLLGLITNSMALVQDSGSESAITMISPMPIFNLEQRQFIKEDLIHIPLQTIIDNPKTAFPVDEEKEDAENTSLIKRELAASDELTKLIVEFKKSKVLEEIERRLHGGFSYCEVK